MSQALVIISLRQTLLCCILTVFIQVMFLCTLICLFYIHYVHSSVELCILAAQHVQHKRSLRFVMVTMLSLSVRHYEITTLFVVTDLVLCTEIKRVLFMYQHMLPVSMCTFKDHSNPALSLDIVSLTCTIECCALENIQSPIHVTVPCAHAVSAQQTQTLTQCCCNVGPTSTTLAQHYSNIESMSRVCWVCTMTLCSRYAPVTRFTFALNVILL